MTLELVRGGGAVNLHLNNYRTGLQTMEYQVSRSICGDSAAIAAQDLPPESDCCAQSPYAERKINEMIDEYRPFVCSHQSCIAGTSRLNYCCLSSGKGSAACFKVDPVIFSQVPAGT